MRTRLLALGSVGICAGAVCAAAWAASLGNLSGQSCGDFLGTWHFVNNQTGGAAPGTLGACFTSGCTSGVQPSKVNASNQHFYVTAAGTLTGASTNLPGKLVLSDFTCTPKCEKDCEPPPK